MNNTCVLCKEDFQSPRSAMWCSQKCRRHWYELGLAVHEVIVCPGCGQEFKQGKLGQKYCSSHCSSKHLHHLAVLANQNIVRICKDCGEEIGKAIVGRRCGKCKYKAYKKTPEGMSNAEYQRKLAVRRKEMRANATDPEECMQWIEMVIKRGGWVTFKELTVDLQQISESCGFNADTDTMSPNKFYEFMWLYCLEWHKKGGLINSRNRIMVRKLKEKLNEN